jgi:hypothetical protein
MSNTRLLRAARSLTLQLGLALLASACEPPTSPKKAADGGVQPERDADVDAEREPATADDAGGDGPGDPPEQDGDTEPDEDGGADAEEDAWVGPPPPVEAKVALCTDAYDSVKLNHPELIRGSWQFNPGGAYVTLPERGYPCLAFLHDGDVRPAMDDPAWTDAANGEFLGFSERSTVPESNYSVAQFRYFRSLVFVPEGAQVNSLTVSALGIDDAIYIELFNSKYPEGVSPLDAGPSDPMVGSCYGNDSASWDFKDYFVEGEVNVVFLVHADMNPATSTLVEVRIEADGAPIPLVSCKDE